jgi:PAP_fibrillin
LDILTRAAETKSEDSDIVLQALVDLERLVRIEARQNERYATELLRNLNGSWRLIFTTGTKNTQDKIGKINYFPIKAVQSFDTVSMAIENGIYVGDFRLVQFAGTFDYDAVKRRIEFDFTKLTLLQLIDLSIGRGQAAQMGAKSGLGSNSNVANAAKDKRAFFNWISANADIATARGGGGGLALWKRVV